MFIYFATVEFKSYCNHKHIVKFDSYLSRQWPKIGHQLLVFQKGFLDQFTWEPASPCAGVVVNQGGGADVVVPSTRWKIRRLHFRCSFLHFSQPKMEMMKTMMTCSASLKVVVILEFIFLRDCMHYNLTWNSPRCTQERFLETSITIPDLLNSSGSLITPI